MFCEGDRNVGVEFRWNLFTSHHIMLVLVITLRARVEGRGTGNLAKSKRTSRRFSRPESTTSRS